MKKGDKLVVSVEGIPVGHAEVEHVGDSQVTVLIPAMRSILGLRVSLETPAPVEPTTETVITGVDRPETPAVITPEEVSAPNNVETPAPVSEPSVPPAAEPVEPAAAAPNETAGIVENPAVEVPSPSQAVTPNAVGE